LDGNILTIRYQGACGGCPSSMMGTLQAIESILRTEFNPYLEVVAL
jgi:Fe-S cluster biogenesis protein NfuA